MSDIEDALQQLESSFSTFLKRMENFANSESDVDSSTDDEWTVVSENRLKIAKGLATAYHKGKLPWISQLMAEEKPIMPGSATSGSDDEFLCASLLDNPLDDNLSSADDAELVCTKCQRRREAYDGLSATDIPALSSDSLRDTVKFGKILTEGTNERSQFSYDRLKFFGSGIYYNTVTKMIFERFPHMSIHNMTTLRSILISNRMIYRWGSQIGLGSSFLQIDDWNNDMFKTISAGMNAYMGAIAVDSEDSEEGMKRVEAWVSKLVGPWISILAGESEQSEQLDPNAIPRVERIYPKPLIKYMINVEKGRSNLELVQLRVKKKVIGRGLGRNTNEAMTRAAMDALQTRDKILAATPPRLYHRYG